MLNRLGMFLFAVGTIWWAKPAEAADGKAPPQVVLAVHLIRHAGKWHDSVRLPNRVQRNCAGHTSATYTLGPGGEITFQNECCKAYGRQKSAKGTARVVDTGGPNTKLMVTLWGPFSVNYCIIDLDP